MKKKIRQILLTLLLFVFSILIISIPTQAAKPAATTVKSKTSYANSKESMTVRGLDANKKQSGNTLQRNILLQSFQKQNVLSARIRFMFLKVQKLSYFEKKTENSYGLQKKSVLQDTFANLTKMTIYM